MILREENNKIKTPSIVSAQEWEAARQQLLVKEKELTRSSDALAAERRGRWWKRSTNSTGLTGE